MATQVDIPEDFNSRRRRIPRSASWLSDDSGLSTDSDEIKIVGLNHVTAKSLDTPLYRAHIWYIRLGRPQRKTLYKCVADGLCPDITKADVDVLPWDKKGQWVNFRGLQQMLEKEKKHKRRNDTIVQNGVLTESLSNLSNGPDFVDELRAQGEAEEATKTKKQLAYNVYKQLAEPSYITLHKVLVYFDVDEEGLKMLPWNDRKTQVVEEKLGNLERQRLARDTNFRTYQPDNGTDGDKESRREKVYKLYLDWYKPSRRTMRAILDGTPTNTFGISKADIDLLQWDSEHQAIAKDIYVERKRKEQEEVQKSKQAAAAVAKADAERQRKEQELRQKEEQAALDRKRREDAAKAEAERRRKEEAERVHREAEQAAHKEAERKRQESEQAALAARAAAERKKAEENRLRRDAEAATARYRKEEEERRCKEAAEAKSLEAKRKKLEEDRLRREAEAATARHEADRRRKEEADRKRAEEDRARKAEAERIRAEQAARKEAEKARRAEEARAQAERVQRDRDERERIRLEEERQRQELASRKAPVIKHDPNAFKFEEVELTEEQRIMRAYTWWNRLAQPSKKSCLKRISELTYCDVSAEDIQLLPWNFNGTMVNISAVHKIMAKEQLKGSL